MATQRDDPEKTIVRQVALFHGRAEPTAETHTARMKQRIDFADGSGTLRAALCDGGAGVCERAIQQRARSLHAAREDQVDGQWKLFWLVHNIEKLAHHGYAQ